MDEDYIELGDARVTIAAWSYDAPDVEERYKSEFKVKFLYFSVLGTSAAQHVIAIAGTHEKKAFTATLVSTLGGKTTRITVKNARFTANAEQDGGQFWFALFYDPKDETNSSFAKNVQQVPSTVLDRLRMKIQHT